MNAPDAAVRHEALRIGGERVAARRSFEVRYPYTGEVIATVPKATVDDVRRAIGVAKRLRPNLTRHERHRILLRARDLVVERRDEIARLITLESGLCLQDTRYEVGRASEQQGKGKDVCQQRHSITCLLELRQKQKAQC